MRDTNGSNAPTEQQPPERLSEQGRAAANDLEPIVIILDERAERAEMFSVHPLFEAGPLPRSADGSDYLEGRRPSCATRGCAGYQQAARSAGPCRHGSGALEARDGRRRSRRSRWCTYMLNGRLA